MKGLDPNKHRIYEGRLLTNTGFMKEGLDPNKHRIYEGLGLYEGRTRS